MCNNPRACFFADFSYGLSGFDIESFYLPLILILSCFMFHTNLLYLFNIFCSPRLILAHLFWKSRRTLSDYMQKMNKPFTISTHTQTKRRRRRRKKIHIPGFEPAPSRFPHQNSYCGLSMEPLGHNCFQPNMLVNNMFIAYMET